MYNYSFAALDDSIVLFDVFLTSDSSMVSPMIWSKAVGSKLMGNGYDVF